MYYTPMTKLTLKSVSKEMSKALGREVELVKGDGYFYVWPVDGEVPPQTCICAYRLNSLSMALWVEEAQSLYAQNEFGNWTHR